MQHDVSAAAIADQSRQQRADGIDHFLWGYPMSGYGSQPDFNADVTNFMSKDSTFRLATDAVFASLPVTHADQAAKDKVTAIAATHAAADPTNAWEWNTYGDDAINGSADDVRRFIQYDGWPTVAPDPGTPEFRVEVESLKARWAGGDPSNPLDPSHVLLGAEETAWAEWQAELNAQAQPRANIVADEMQALDALKAGAETMHDGLDYAWTAGGILWAQGQKATQRLRLVQRGHVACHPRPRPDQGEGRRAGFGRPERGGDRAGRGEQGGRRAQRGLCDRHVGRIAGRQRPGLRGAVRRKSLRRQRPRRRRLRTRCRPRWRRQTRRSPTRQHCWRTPARRHTRPGRCTCVRPRRTTRPRPPRWRPRRANQATAAAAAAEVVAADKAKIATVEATAKDAQARADAAAADAANQATIAANAEATAETQRNNAAAANADAQQQAADGGDQRGQCLDRGGQRREPGRHGAAGRLDRLDRPGPGRGGAGSEERRCGEGAGAGGGCRRRSGN